MSNEPIRRDVTLMRKYIRRHWPNAIKFWRKNIIERRPKHMLGNYEIYTELVTSIIIIIPAC